MEAFGRYYKLLLETSRDEGRHLKTKDRLLLTAQLGATVQTDYRRGCGRAIPNDMVEFVDNFCDKTPAGRNLQDIQYVDPGGFREMCHTLHRAGRWAEFGFSVFELASDLAGAFMLTDPPPVPEGGLSLPFQCFALRVPPGIVPMFIDGKQQWAPLIWVHQFRSYHRVYGETDFIRVAAEHKGVQVWRDRFPPDITRDEDESIFNRTFLGDPEYVEEDQLTPIAAVRVLRNFVSWLNTQDPSTVKPQATRRKKKKRKKAKVEEATARPRVYLMGTEVKLRPELRRMASEVALGAIEGWQLRTRHIVRGHWKQQPYGPARSLRREKWIEPYWRGPEGADVWAHIYSGE